MKVCVWAAALSLVFFNSCLPGDAARREAPGLDAGPAMDAARNTLRRQAEKLAAGLSLEAACGQVILTGIGGRGALDPASRLLLQTVPAGGIILFGFNVPEDAADLRPALDQAQTEARGSGAGIPLFVAIDHEGGDVFRFKRGMTVLPSARTLGQAGGQAAARAGATAGRELRALGVSLALAPVVEASDDLPGSFLETRSFSTDPAEAGRLASAFLSALQAEGTAAAAKHYPGSGAEDPHTAAVAVTADLKEIKDRYDQPFRAAIGAGAAVVMLSHSKFPALDADAPASLSPAVISRLKEELGFGGIVLTDDLSMKALSGQGGIGESAVRAILSGADMVMTSGGRDAREAYFALVSAAKEGRLSERRLRDASARILTQKLRFGLLPGLADGPNT